MSFRELTMIDVREVLRRWQAGQSARQMAREGVVDRKTAGRYVTAAEELELDERAELTEEAVRAVLLRVQGRPVPEPSSAWQKLEGERERIKGWLEGDKPLRLTRVAELLARDGVVVGYTTLRRYAHRELGWRERPATVRVDDSPPGEEAQMDFGLAGYVTDDEGRRRKLWVLIVVLSFSRYMFVWPTFVQTLDAICAGLDAAWSFFGGVAKRVVFDNPKTAVLLPDPKSPTLNRGFAEYAQQRGFFVDLARVRRPQDKPRVENQVAYVRERWFAGELFPADEKVLRDAAARWCREVAGARVHGTTRQVPREVFTREEREHLLPFAGEVFDVPQWSRAKVHPDHHVQVAKALYSVPTQYLGRTLDVRLDRASVRLYAGSELIKVHRRVAAGRRSTDPNDYPTHKAALATKSIDGLIERALAQGEHVGVYAERLLGGPLPWTRMRQAYGLLRLCDRYGRDRVDALCARSLEFDVIDVTRIERMLKTAQKLETRGAQTGRVVSLPPGRFARDPKSFATMRDGKGGEG